MLPVHEEIRLPVVPQMIFIPGIFPDPVELAPHHDDVGEGDRLFGIPVPVQSGAGVAEISFSFLNKISSKSSFL